MVKLLFYIVQQKKMVADYMTKSLHGGQFRKFRDIIMGYTSTQEIIPNDLLLKERVKNNVCE